MGFQDAVRTCFQKYVVISGRAARSEYWWWFLFLLLGNFVAGLIDSTIFGWGENAARIVGPIFGLAVFLPSLCVGGRRLHDRDMSAWWLLLLLIPIVGSLILLVIFLFPGTPGPNRFGPDPLGQGSGGYGDASYAPSSIPRTGGSDSR